MASKSTAPVAMTARIDLVVDDAKTKREMQRAGTTIKQQLDGIEGDMAGKVNKSIAEKTQRISAGIKDSADKLNAVLDLGLKAGLGAGAASIAAFLRSNSAEALRFKSRLSEVETALSGVGRKLATQVKFGDKSLYEWAEKLTSYLNNISTDQLQKAANIIKGIAITVASLKTISLGADLLQSGANAAIIRRELFGASVGGAAQGAAARVGTGFLGNVGTGFLGTAGGVAAGTAGVSGARGLSAAFGVAVDAARRSEARESLATVASLVQDNKRDLQRSLNAARDSVALGLLGKPVAAKAADVRSLKFMASANASMKTAAATAAEAGVIPPRIPVAAAAAATSGIPVAAVAAAGVATAVAVLEGMRRLAPTKLGRMLGMGALTNEQGGRASIGEISSAVSAAPVSFAKDYAKTLGGGVLATIPVVGPLLTMGLGKYRESQGEKAAIEASRESAKNHITKADPNLALYKSNIAAQQALRAGQTDFALQDAGATEDVDFAKLSKRVPFLTKMKKAALDSAEAFKKLRDDTRLGTAAYANYDSIYTEAITRAIQIELQLTAIKKQGNAEDDNFLDELDAEMEGTMRRQDAVKEIRANYKEAASNATTSYWERDEGFEKQRTGLKDALANVGGPGFGGLSLGVGVAQMPQLAAQRLQGAENDSKQLEIERNGILTQLNELTEARALAEDEREKNKERMRKARDKNIEKITGALAGEQTGSPAP